MKSAPLSHPRCWSHSFGVGAVMTLLIFLSALLSPVKGETAKGLTCSTPSSSEKCVADKEACCFRFLKGLRSGCEYGSCPDTGCMEDKNPEVGIVCYCATKLCNDKRKDTWDKDPLYNGSGATTITTRLLSWSASTLPLFVAALSSLT